MVHKSFKLKWRFLFSAGFFGAFGVSEKRTGYADLQKLKEN